MSGLEECSKTFVNLFGGSAIEAKKTIRKVIQVIEQEIIDNGGVQFVDHFTIENVLRKAKVGRDPKSKIVYPIPECHKLKASAGKGMFEKMNPNLEITEAVI